MYNLHIISNSVFTNKFIDFINTNFNEQEHIFLVTGGLSLEANKIVNKENVFCLHQQSVVRNLFYLFKMMSNSKQIFLHGLFENRTMLLLLFFKRFANRSSWFIWGNDLYSYTTNNKTKKEKGIEFVKKIIIKRFSRLVTYVYGDYELAKKWYGAKGQYAECIMYPSNLYQNIALKDNESDIINILLGNSADPTNNHEEVINILKRYKNSNIKIFCPLSYGDEKYAAKIRNIGNSFFGDKFVPIMDFLPYKEYLNLLSKINIAIFNHNRQQGMGNIISLLGLGKKVYIKDGISSLTTFRELGVEIFTVENINMHMLSETELKSNRNIIKEYFSEENYTKQLKQIFYKDNN